MCTRVPVYIRGTCICTAVLEHHVGFLRSEVRTLLGSQRAVPLVAGWQHGCPLATSVGVYLVSPSQRDGERRERWW